MPRRKEGPRLYLRERKGRASVWVILDDNGYEKSTGFGEGDLRSAEKVFADYLAAKHSSQVGTHRPSALPIFDVLKFYGEAKTPNAAASEARKKAFDSASFHLEILSQFWGMTPISEIRGATCRDYVVWRTHDGKLSRRWPERRKRAVSDQTARRELVILSAAVNLYHKEYGLETVPIVTMPAIAESRRKALTHSQAAALLAGALGFYRDENGKIQRRPKSTRTQRKRAARFIIIGLYSGTRHSAITAGRWLPSIDSPYLDLDRGIMHRRGDEEEQTKKRRPDAKITPRLLAHLRRWRRMDMEGPGEPITYVIPMARRGKLAGRLRKGWTGARKDAGLGPEVTPHVLRHTAGTWLVQGRVPTREAADFIGMTEDQFERTYYSADPDFQTGIGPAFDEAKRRANKLRRAQESPNKASKTVNETR